MAAKQTYASEVMDALSLFEAIVTDHYCLFGSIQFCDGQWWVQFVDADGQKTMPAIDNNPAQAIRKAIDSFRAMLKIEAI